MNLTSPDRYNDLYQAWQFTKEAEGFNPQLAELKDITWDEGEIVTDLFRASWCVFGTPAMGVAFMIEASDGEKFIQVYP